MTTTPQGEAVRPHFPECDTPEPALVNILRHYYRQAFTEGEARRLAERYLAALTPPIAAIPSAEPVSNTSSQLSGDSGQLPSARLTDRESALLVNAIRVPRTKALYASTRSDGGSTDCGLTMEQAHARGDHIGDVNDMVRPSAEPVAWITQEQVTHLDTHGNAKIQRTMPLAGQPLFAAPPNVQSGDRAAMLDELAMLIRRLARALKKASPANDLPAKALDYLRDAGVEQGVFRGEPDIANAYAAFENALAPSGDSGVREALVDEDALILTAMNESHQNGPLFHAVHPLHRNVFNAGKRAARAAIEREEREKKA